MKFTFCLAGLCFVALCSSPKSQAAVIEVSGVIEGTSQRPGQGETIDYLKFEMLSTGPFSLSVPNLGGTGRFYTLAGFTGDNTQFGAVSGSTVLFLSADVIAAGGIPTLSRTLNMGTYIMIVDAYVNSQYDFGDGFVPVNRDGGFFPSDPYSFTIQGDVKAVELWEGLLDPQPNGAFTITTYPVPEPSTLGMLCLGIGIIIVWAHQTKTTKSHGAKYKM